MRATGRSLGPLARFRVYPQDGSSLYAVGIVWPTKAAMVAHLAQQGVPKARDTAAICRSLDVYNVRQGRPMRKIGLFAEVHFYRSCMGGGLVAHEFLHATFAYARRVGIKGRVMFRDDTTDPNVDAEEERLCEVHGRMVARFVNRCWKVGIYSAARRVTRGTG